MHLPVVYVHGFIGHLQFPELRVGLDASSVMSLDLLGYGLRKGVVPRTIAEQVAHLDTSISAAYGQTPVVLVGHSGGAAICILFAKAFPWRVACLVSAEGNLAPSDAFLSSRLAPMAPTKVREWLDQTRENPGAFLARERLVLGPEPMARWNDWLGHQSAEVIHAMARALLVETVHPNYATAVMEVMAQTATYLVQGESSKMSLGVPPRLRAMAAGSYTLSGTGHLMVLEAPERFADTIVKIVADLPMHKTAKRPPYEPAAWRADGECRPRVK